MVNIAKSRIYLQKESLNQGQFRCKSICPFKKPKLDQNFKVKTNIHGFDYMQKHLEEV